MATREPARESFGRYGNPGDMSTNQKYTHDMSQSSLYSTRLILRPFGQSDATAVQRLAGDRSIADTTMNIPHPYEDGMAEEWIEAQQTGYAENRLVTFAVVLRDKARLIGAIGLTIDSSLNKSELGYWIGRPYWNKGYATEAAQAVLDFGFEKLKLNRITAGHLARNPASGRVMEKAGMLLEGRAREDAVKWGKYEDVVNYGILRADWENR